ncbi:MAG TPA: 3'-5' exonuclease, partial [Mycobacteriales bacterium]|nr:3'-5' exonuclease [Mycobacteriales bacterium]
VLQHVQSLVATATTVGVIARAGSRLGAIRRAADAAGLSFTDWSAPLHRVDALRHIRACATVALRANGSDDAAATDVLEQLAVTSCATDDVETRDEISEACAELRSLVAAGTPLARAIERCRPDEPGDAPVRPGIHFLNAHLGKGQEFDHVVIVGLEEGIVPHFKATLSGAPAGAIAEELRALIVMASRARKSLLVTCAATVPIASGWPKPRDPSRWWATLAECV